MATFDATAPLETRAEQALEFAQHQVRNLITAHPDYFPLFTEDGRWRHGKEPWTNWCEGFLGGMMWIFARRTGDPYWRERAEHYSRLIEERKHDRDVHDLGFLFWSTWKRWFDLTGDPAIKRGRRHRRPDDGAALQRAGEVSALVRRAGELLHRHHDERRHHLLRRQRDGRRRSAAARAPSTA